jgi:hypothetical protein
MDSKLYYRLFWRKHNNLKWLTGHVCPFNTAEQVIQLTCISPTPAWDDMQKADIISETFAEVLTKSTYFQFMLT